MSPSKEYLVRCASQTGYQVGSLEKVVRLGGLAHDIGRQPLLYETLALKGGTALNLGFGPPKRLSIDLDFNYVGSVDRDQMLKDCTEIEKAVIGIAARAGVPCTGLRGCLCRTKDLPPVSVSSRNARPN